MVKRKKKLNKIQKTIIAIISFLFILTTVVAVSIIFLNPETRIKNTISSLTAEYYEDYFYDAFIDSIKGKDLDQVMEPYTQYGFANIYLRQLLYHKDDAGTTKFLLEHCDENKTAVKIYPEAPYSKKSYRTDYIYSCDFE